MVDGKNNMNGKRKILDSEREIGTTEGVDASASNRGTEPALHVPGALVGCKTAIALIYDLTKAGGEQHWVLGMTLPSI
eukprot:7459159-Heterocapsa_arctica.AAC.1